MLVKMKKPHIVNKGMILAISACLLSAGAAIAAKQPPSIKDSASEADLELWNLHVPKWTRVSIVTDPSKVANKCLELRDEDPYDYALAERAFPESRYYCIKNRF